MLVVVQPRSQGLDIRYRCSPATMYMRRRQNFYALVYAAVYRSCCIATAGKFA